MGPFPRIMGTRTTTVRRKVHNARHDLEGLKSFKYIIMTIQ